jgi:hypothetical protein
MVRALLHKGGKRFGEKLRRAGVKSRDLVRNPLEKLSPRISLKLTERSIVPDHLLARYPTWRDSSRVGEK